MLRSRQGAKRRLSMRLLQYRLRSRREQDIGRVWVILNCLQFVDCIPAVHSDIDDNPWLSGQLLQHVGKNLAGSAIPIPATNESTTTKTALPPRNPASRMLDNHGSLR